VSGQLDKETRPRNKGKPMISPTLQGRGAVVTRVARGSQRGEHGMTGLAREFASEGISFNVLAPCIVNTEHVQAATARSPDAVRKYFDFVPMARPAELAE
jgi:hypothetical protein